MDSRKRKRDTNFPRITYHASGRTFDRLFREESLTEMKAVARAKLGLAKNTHVAFEQIRDGKSIDLEDDDDFDAFYSLAHSASFADVRVCIKETTKQPAAVVQTVVEPDVSMYVEGPQSRRPDMAPEDGQLDSGGPATTSGVSFVSQGPLDANKTKPVRKKRKIATEAVSHAVEPPSTTEDIHSSKKCSPNITTSNGQTEKPEASISAFKSRGVLPAEAKGDKKKKKKDRESAQDTEHPAVADSKTKKRKSLPSDETFEGKLSAVISRTLDVNHKPGQSAPEPMEGKNGKKKVRKERPRGEQKALELASKPEAGKLSSASKDMSTLKDKSKGKAHFQKPSLSNTPPSEEVQAILAKFLARKRASLAVEVLDKLVDKKTAPSPVGVGKMQCQETLEPATVSVPGNISAETGVPPAVSVLLKKMDNERDFHLNKGLVPSKIPVVDEDVPSNKYPPIQHKGDVSHPSSSESEDELPVRLFPTPSDIPPPLDDASLYMNMDLDAIVRGPYIDPAFIPSPHSSGDEGEEDDGGEQNLEEDDDTERDIRSRPSGPLKFFVVDSSEDDTDGDLDSHIDRPDNQTPAISRPLPMDIITVSEPFSFQDNNASDKMDTSGDTAFSEALVADCAGLPSGVGEPAGSPPPVPTPSESMTAVPGSDEPKVSIALSSDSSQAADAPESQLPVEDQLPTGDSKGKTKETSRPPQREGRASKSQRDDSDSVAKRTRNARKMHPISTYKPPTPPAESHSSRSAKPSNSAVPLQSVMGPANSTSQNSRSLPVAGWEVLQTSSVPESTMIDELRSSSPIGGAQNIGSIARSLANLQGFRNPIQNDSEEEARLLATIDSSRSSRSKSVEKFRSISCIVGQAVKFSTPASSRRINSRSENSKQDFYGNFKALESGESDDTEESGDSEEEPQSHIPKSRRAGVAMIKGKKHKY